MINSGGVAEERVVSVRELSTQLAVNSRTVMKAYEYLQAEDIIYPERGMGFYLAKDAVKKVMKIQKKEFFDNNWPMYSSIWNCSASA